jgi:uncharacterized protein
VIDSNAHHSEQRAGGERSTPLIERWTRRVFLAPHGIRSPWRVLVAIALYKVVTFVLGAALVSSASIDQWLRSALLGQSVLTPGFLLFGEGIRTAGILLVGLAMAKLEDRTFSDYRVPVKEALGRRFWQGVPCGLGMLALLMSTMRLLSAVSFTNQRLNGSAALRDGCLYGIGYILVAFFEEATFRGYLQSTLETEFGFWTSAVLLSVIFGAMHSQNPGESPIGVAMAGGFGLLAAFSVLRTRTVWFAVGLHAAWDWGQSFFYGVPNSGIAARGHVLNSSMHGSNWVTGGPVGPEGSLLVFPVLLLMALAIHVTFPARRRDC